METPFYRHNLEALNEKFPNKNVLMIKDVAEFEGRHYTTIQRKYKLPRGGIPKTEYAHILSIWDKMPACEKRAIRKLTAN